MTSMTLIPFIRGAAIRRVADRCCAPALVASAFLLLAACGGSGAPRDGLLCAECGDDDTPCVAVESLAVPSAHYEDLCGGESTAKCPYCKVENNQTVCSVKLTCTQEYDSPARRCYPNKPETQPSPGVDPSFECKGVPPRTS